MVFFFGLEIIGFFVMFVSSFFRRLFVILDLRKIFIVIFLMLSIFLEVFYINILRVNILVYRIRGYNLVYSKVIIFIGRNKFRF